MIEALSPRRGPRALSSVVAGRGSIAAAGTASIGAHITGEADAAAEKVGSTLAAGAVEGGLECRLGAREG